jgi:type III secretion system YscD/HrpQ family protein
MVEEEPPTNTAQRKVQPAKKELTQKARIAKPKKTRAKESPEMETEISEETSSETTLEKAFAPEEETSPVTEEESATLVDKDSPPSKVSEEKDESSTEAPTPEMSSTASPIEDTSSSETPLESKENDTSKGPLDENKSSSEPIPESGEEPSAMSEMSPKESPIKDTSSSETSLEGEEKDTSKKPLDENKSSSEPIPESSEEPSAMSEMSPKESPIKDTSSSETSLEGEEKDTSKESLDEIKPSAEPISEESEEPSAMSEMSPKESPVKDTSSSETSLEGEEKDTSKESLGENKPSAEPIPESGEEPSAMSEMSPKESPIKDTSSSETSLEGEEKDTSINTPEEPLTEDDTGSKKGESLTDTSTPKMTPGGLQTNEDLLSEESSENAPTEAGDAPHVDFELLDVESRWLLKVLSGPNIGAEFSMHGGSSYLIGTDSKECDIVFQDLSVSRKHARLSIDTKDNATLEDLGSRNGTLIDGERVEKRTIQGNVLVSMGTTTFMLIDREAERTTIVSTPTREEEEASSFEESKEKEPPKEETKEETLGPIRDAAFGPIKSELDRVKEEERKQAKMAHAMSSLMILAVVTGLILVIGIGSALLFRAEEVTAPLSVNPEQEISRAVADFPAIRYSYNPTNQRLLLIGHVSKLTDRSKLLDLLQQLKFIRDVDFTNVVIDSLVCQDINVVLSRNPNWRGITITSPAAGRYVVSGFLQSKEQANELFDYIGQNFSYVDLLERKVVVEEELLGQVKRELTDSGFRGVVPSLTGGDLTLAGTVGAGTSDRFQKLVTLFRSLPGIRSVQLAVSEAGQKEAYINLTEKYHITGYSKQKKNTSVVINGKILAPGDVLDGMMITEISPTTIYLEKEGAKYKIDFNR